MLGTELIGRRVEVSCELGNGVTDWMFAVMAFGAFTSGMLSLTVFLQSREVHPNEWRDLFG